MIRVFYLVCLFSVLATAQDKNDLVQVKTFAEMIKGIKNNYPLLEEKHIDIDIADTSLAKSKATRLPTVNLTGTWGYEISENSTTIAAGNRHRTLDPYQFSLTLRQDLYTGGRVGAGIKKATALKEESKFRLLQEENSSFMRGASFYIDLLRSRELIKAYKESVDFHKEILEKVEEKVDGEVESDAAKTQIESRYARAKAQYEKEKITAKAIAKQFKEICGYDPADELEPITDISKYLPSSEQKAYTDAKGGHPLILARKQNIKAAEQVINEAKSRFRPTVYLEANVTDADSLSGSDEVSDSSSILLGVQWNLYNGGHDQADLKLRKLQLDKTKAIQQQENNRISTNVSIAWSNYQGVLVEYNFFKKYEEGALKTVEYGKEQFELGELSLARMLDHQDDYIRATSSRIEAKYRKELMLYSILSNMGLLRDKLLEK